MTLRGSASFSYHSKGRLFQDSSRMKARIFDVEKGHWTRGESLWCGQGREDLRLDVRLLQFVGLVAALLKHDPSAAGHGLSIRKFVCTPLTHRVGLIEWMEGTRQIFHVFTDWQKFCARRAAAAAAESSGGTETPSEPEPVTGSFSEAESWRGKVLELSEASRRRQRGRSEAPAALQRRFLRQAPPRPRGASSIVTVTICESV